MQSIASREKEKSLKRKRLSGKDRSAVPKDSPAENSRVLNSSTGDSRRKGNLLREGKPLTKTSAEEEFSASNSPGEQTLRRDSSSKENPQADESAGEGNSSRENSRRDEDLAPIDVSSGSESSSEVEPAVTVRQYINPQVPPAEKKSRPRYCIATRAQAVALQTYGVRLTDISRVTGMTTAQVRRFAQIARARGYNPAMDGKILDEYLVDGNPTGRKGRRIKKEKEEMESGVAAERRRELQGAEQEKARKLEADLLLVKQGVKTWGQGGPNDICQACRAL